MKKAFIGKAGMFLTLLFMTLMLPAGIAHAYTSAADYYSLWNQSGIPYKNNTAINQPQNTPANNQNITPIVNTPTVNTNTNTGSNSISDYYSRLLNSRYTGIYTPSTSGNNSSNSGSGGATGQPPVNTQTPPNTGQQNSSGDVGSLSASEKQMLDLVNQERIKAGLPAFTVDSELVELARMKSEDMYENNYFSHTSPTYGTAYDMEKKAGINARVMGAENIAKASSVTRAHELFMGSEGHRTNILDPRHDTIGIGIVETSSGVFVTQLFLGD